jgi:hypothetical protein
MEELRKMHAGVTNPSNAPKTAAEAASAPKPAPKQ